MTMHCVFFPPKVVFAEGSVQQIGAEAVALGRRAFLVTHRPGRFTATGIVDQVEKLLGEAGVEAICHGVEPESAIPTFDRGARECREAGCDMVIGLGGGSALDAAKGIAIMATHEGSIRDYQMGQATFERPSLPVIGVPTTAGTGSEVSRVAVVGNEETGIKKSVYDPSFIPRVVLLDPELTLSLPPELTCSTGIDALSHALESYVSLNANPFTEAFALQAFKLIGQSLTRAVLDGRDIEARRDMLLASCLAGLSLNAGVGAAHILAQPVSAVTGLSHSQAIAIMLPHVVQTNLDYATEKYARAADALSEGVDGLGPKDAATGVLCALQRFQEVGGLPRRFRDLGVTKQNLMDILDNALRWQMHIKSNPRPVDRSVLDGVLQAAY